MKMFLKPDLGFVNKSRTQRSVNAGIGNDFAQKNPFKTARIFTMNAAYHLSAERLLH